MTLAFFNAMAIRVHRRLIGIVSAVAGAECEAHY